MAPAPPLVAAAAGAYFLSLFLPTDGRTDSPRLLTRRQRPLDKRPSHWTLVGILIKWPGKV